MKRNSLPVACLLLYFVGITLILIYLFGTYRYFDLNLILYVLSFYLFGAVIYFDFVKKGTFFSYGIIFNLFGCLYTNFYIFELVSEGMEIDKYVFMAMRLSYLAIFSFDMAYMFVGKKKPVPDSGENMGIPAGGDNGLMGPEYEESVASDNKPTAKKRKYNIQRLLFLTSMLFLISLAAEFYVIFVKVGLAPFFAATRSTKTLMLADYSLLSFYQSTIPIIAAIALYVYLEYKSKFSFSLFLVAIAIAVFNSYIRGSRAEMLCILLPIMFLLNHYKKISNRTVCILGVGTVILFGLWKSLYYNNKNINFDSEFNTWYEICRNVLPSEFKYRFGSSYLQTFINLIIPVTGTQSLSVWYLENFAADVLAKGGGRGFSCVLEAYMNFSFIGCIVVFYLYGLLFKKLEVKGRGEVKSEAESGFSYKMILAFIFMTSIYLFFRAESYSLWKNMVWFKIYPTALIFWISKARH